MIITQAEVNLLVLQPYDGKDVHIIIASSNINYGAYAYLVVNYVGDKENYGLGDDTKAPKLIIDYNQSGNNTVPEPSTILLLGFFYDGFKF